MKTAAVALGVLLLTGCANAPQRCFRMPAEEVSACDRANGGESVSRRALMYFLMLHKIVSDAAEAGDPS